MASSSDATTEKDTIYCGKCSSKVKKSVKFCWHCAADQSLIRPHDFTSTAQHEPSLPHDNKNDTINNFGRPKKVMDFQAFVKNKTAGEKDCGVKKKKKSKVDDGEVVIQIGLKKLNDKGVLKTFWGKRLPVAVLKSDDYFEILQKASSKWKDFDRSLIDWEPFSLVFDDGRIAMFMPGQETRFVLREYKDALGKDFKRIVLFLCSESDFHKAEGIDDIGSGSDSDVSYTAPPYFEDDHLYCKSEQSEQRSLNESSMPETATASSSGYSNYVSLIDLEDLEDEHNDSDFQTAIAASLVETSEEQPVEFIRKFIQKHLTLSDSWEDDVTRIIVNRTDIYKSTMRSIRRKTFSFYKPLTVTFAGEEAVDTGGPKREYLRLLMREVAASQIFKKGWFVHDLAALNENVYLFAGQLTAWSVLQGGQGPKCLSSDIYEFVQGKTDGKRINIDDIADDKLTEILLKLEEIVEEDAFNSFLEKYADCICAYGYLNIYLAKLEDKKDIMSALYLQHFKFSVLAEIQQFKDGMNMIGEFGNSVFKNKIVFDFILGNTHPDLTWSQFKQLFEISFAEVGSNKRCGEDKTMYAWELYLQDVNDREICVTFADLLAFITGADAVPPLGFSIKPGIEFYDSEENVKRLPWSSTCSNVLYLPRNVTPETFKEMMNQSIIEGHGFGKV